MVAFWPVLTPRQTLFLQTLRDRGWLLTVIVWDRDGSRQADTLLSALVDDIVYVSVPAPTWSLRLLARLPQYLTKLSREIRRIGDASLWILTHYLHLPVAPLMSGKVIYDAAEMYAIDLGHYAGRFKRPATAVLGGAELLMARALDGITTVDSLGGWLEARYRRTGRPVVPLWNVPSLGQACPPQGDGPEAHRPPWVAFAGGLMQEKGIRVALAAAARVRRSVPDARFTFFGVLKDDGRAIDKLVRDLDIASNVDFVDAMPYPELQAVLRQHSVGLALYQAVYHYPLVSAGNARKIFTYMQAGLPVVAPAFGEIGKVVTSHDCGVLVDTSDPAAVADAIVRLLEEPALAREMGRRGRTAVQETLNWEAEEQKLSALIDTIVRDA